MAEWLKALLSKSNIPFWYRGFESHPCRQEFNSMQKIILISCVSKKLPRPARAEELYVSPLFKKNLAYAKSLKPDSIYILSAKYGLVSLNQELDPYEQTLNTMKALEIKDWAGQVLNSLAANTDLDKDRFVFLAGEKYRKYLLPHIKHYEVPLQGLGIGRQLHFLKQKLSHGG